MGLRDDYIDAINRAAAAGDHEAANELAEYVSGNMPSAQEIQQQDFDAMPWHEKLAIGAGQSVDQLITGVKDLAGVDVEQARQDQARVDQVDSGWKTAGNIMGDVGMASIPGIGMAGMAGRAGLPLATRAAAGLGGEAWGAGVVEGIQQQSPTAGATAAATTALVGGGLPKALGVGSKAADKLYQQGVKLTPGQRWGGIVKGAEELLSYIPGFAKPVQKAKDKALQSWNGVVRSIADDVSDLAPHEAVAATKKAVKAEYEDIFSGTAALSDDLFKQWSTKLEEAQSVMPPKEYKQLQKTFANLAEPISRGKGKLNGKALQTLDSGLGKLSNQAFKRGDGIAGDVYGSAKEALRQSMPEGMSSRLAQNNTAYSKFKVLESATGKVEPSKRGGIFTPDELIATSAAGRRPQAATGRAPLQREGVLASEVLTPANKLQGLAAVVPAVTRPIVNEPLRRVLTRPELGQAARAMPGLAAGSSLAGFLDQYPILDEEERSRQRQLQIAKDLRRSFK